MPNTALFLPTQMKAESLFENFLEPAICRRHSQSAEGYKFGGELLVSAVIARYMTSLIV